ncbi:helicase-related protein [Mesorhizobium sp. LNJC405B00]|uniref:helicase-related protein n=1 Tax=Mesorhizobium sp. LNJC405B00 TaxID=1287281 RepID=UPI000A8EA7E7|nr:helicase-related protein [Mesorhizobium sp. LNJC405B00]
MVSVSPSPEPTLREQFRAALESGIAPEMIVLPPSTWHPDYPCWRFLSLLRRCPTPTLDHGVLLRQAVRWSGGKFFVGGCTPALTTVGTACGVTLSAAGDLIAAPYRPTWLLDEHWLDGQGLDEAPVPAIPDESLPAEPWLWSLAKGQMRSWHSAAQKEACWQALTAAPGSTSLLGLPTGAGKSLSFQLAARFSAGVTIVVVPTTALAIHQALAAKDILADFPHLGPRYFSANDPTSDPAAVRAALRDGSCRLLFASPESCVSGSLRAVIDDLAAAGRLDTLVVDEAHIIDSWGGHFRVEFQLLALRRNQWLALSGGTLRTLLLSATFTPHCLDLLRTMFGGDRWQQFACQRLRPEISYFRGGFTVADDREAALLEALHHIPRPLILYVTEVDEAIHLREVLVNAGFAATECFHGDTSGSDRRRLLLAWRSNEIEIMVATSAFGMGVDKPDVRAVVHACYPENVNRYYQEVGRGGRDGAKSIALWIPVIPKDRRVATSLLPRMLGADLIRLRWKTLLAAARDKKDSVLDMPTNAKHQRLMGGRSYGENVRWNKRLLLMMARAGLIDIVGLQFEEDASEPDGRVERVSIRCNFVPSDLRIAEMLRASRERDLGEAKRGITALDDYLAGKSKICRLLRREYGAETIIACGGCFACRDEHLDPHSIPALDFDPPRLTKPKLDIVATEIFSSGAKAIGAVADRVADLVREHGLIHFLCASDLLNSLTTALAERLIPTSRYYYRLDDAREIGRLNVDPASHVVAIHGRIPDRAMLRVRAGSRVSHLFPKDAQITDANERVLLTHDGASFFPSYDEWLRQV